MCEMLWSDPKAAEGRGPSQRGVGLGFGPDVTRKFLDDNQLDLLVRSHEVSQAGAGCPSTSHLHLADLLVDELIAHVTDMFSNVTCIFCLACPFNASCCFQCGLTLLQHVCCNALDT